MDPYTIKIENDIFKIKDNYSENEIIFTIGKYEETLEWNPPKNANPAFQISLFDELENYLKENFKEYL